MFGLAPVTRTVVVYKGWISCPTYLSSSDSGGAASGFFICSAASSGWWTCPGAPCRPGPGCVRPAARRSSARRHRPAPCADRRWRPGIAAPARTRGRLPAGDFHRAVERRAGGVIGHGQRHVVRRNRLHQRGRQAHRIAVRPGLRYAAEEFEELGRMHDGVRHLAFPDQIFLGDLAAEVAAFGQQLGAHHRQGDMVLHARFGFGFEQVAAGGGEEGQHVVVREGGRVGHVDHHVGAGQHGGQAFAGNGVDAGVGRGGNGVVAALLQDLDGFAADQAGAANNDDFHNKAPVFALRAAEGPGRGHRVQGSV